jgi:hypothetical protein
MSVSWYDVQQSLELIVNVPFPVYFQSRPSEGFRVRFFVYMRWKTVGHLTDSDISIANRGAGGEGLC